MTDDKTESERLRAELAQAQLRVARLEHDLEDLEDELERLRAELSESEQRGYERGLRYAAGVSATMGEGAELERLRARVAELDGLDLTKLPLGFWR